MEQHPCLPGLLSNCPSSNCMLPDSRYQKTSTQCQGAPCRCSWEPAAPGDKVGQSSAWTYQKKYGSAIAASMEAWSALRDLLVTTAFSSLLSGSAWGSLAASSSLISISKAEMSLCGAPPQHQVLTQPVTSFSYCFLRKYCLSCHTGRDIATL